MAGSHIENGVYKTNVATRNRRGRLWRTLYFSSLVFALITLLILLVSIIDQSVGLVAKTYEIKPETLSSKPLTDLSNTELVEILSTVNVRNDSAARNRLLVYTRSYLSKVPDDQFTSTQTGAALSGSVLADELEHKLVKELTLEDYQQILTDNLAQADLIKLIEKDLLKPKFEKSWTLFASLFNRSEIELTVHDQYPDSSLEWHSWLNGNFISAELSDTDASQTGILPAILGSLWLMFLTILFAFPIGVGAAIYLEEYASDTWLNRVIETNIRNLAGVPSIIYGMLGLAIFVRVLGSLTSGAFLGMDGDGRSVLSAALTMALLILPLIIINSQEAIRAVPSSLREASYGLGATQWQTIWRQVLPAALPGILTGTILAMSRAVGETAPLIVVGVAAYITTNPDGPFSRFTALPRLIYYWTSKPDPQFRNTASAGIIVLLLMLLSMNSIAIILRNRASNRRI